MAKQILQYSAMVEAALRAVVRQSLSEVAENGLPGNHHFYITFRTSYPGVQVPDYLRARYPSEMTIVLQFQFYDLTVDDAAFSVTLTFNNAPERLVIPLRAITVFADPSVNFALPFQPVEPSVKEAAASAPIKTATLKPPSSKIKQAKTEKTEADKNAVSDKNAGPDKNTVVSLDQFRRK
jgi:hypothetical protein